MAPAAASIKHLVVVAGPSKAGKSTILRQLASGTLMPAILQRLPEGAARWPVMDPLDLPRWLPALLDHASQPSHAGLLMHYDMTRSRLAYARDYANDPALLLLRLAERVTLLEVRPRPRQLLRQWAHKKLGARTGGQRRTRLLLAPLVEVAWCLLGRLRGRSPRLPGLERFLNALDKRRLKSRGRLSVYLRPGGLATLYRAWDAFVNDVAATGLPIVRIRVVADPSGDIGAEARWLVHLPEPR